MSFCVKSSTDLSTYLPVFLEQHIYQYYLAQSILYISNSVYLVVSNW